MENSQNQVQAETTISEAELKRIYDELQRSNAEQAIYAKKQYRMGIISAIANIAALCVVIFAVYTIIPKIDSLLTQMEGSMTDITKITSELAEVDFNTIAQNVDSLVSTSETSISEAMGKLEDIDFESLNNAIHNLEGVVKPLSDFFGAFKR